VSRGPGGARHDTSEPRTHDYLQLLPLTDTHTPQAQWALLRRSFVGVKTEFTDLDGLSWDVARSRNVPAGVCVLRVRRRWRWMIVRCGLTRERNSGCRFCAWVGAGDGCAFVMRREEEGSSYATMRTVQQQARTTTILCYDRHATLFGSAIPTLPHADYVRSLRFESTLEMEDVFKVRRGEHFGALLPSMSSTKVTGPRQSLQSQRAQ
jgi:hypothetical protein